MHYLIPPAFAVVCLVVFASLNATKRRKDQIVIEAARQVAETPFDCTALGALKTAIQLYDEGQL